ncbi:MAG TPA: Uma2 family endonuclease [Longimicrobium sp.]|nr:Uma2 family endonuclease [Longimicrobium sp.]
MTPLAQPLVSRAEYLALERRASEKSEYVDGRIYAMAGTSRFHNLIVINIVRELATQLRDRPCETYASEMRVKVQRTGMYTYPDVVAVCEEPRLEDAELDTLLNPSVIVEVLSPSTESYDRGEKFAHYRRLESLREYVLVAQTIRRIEHFRREGDHWVFTEISDPDGELALPSLGCVLRLADIYQRVDFPAAGSAREG